MAALDPTLVIAHALRATPGAYGLLLGSGVSSAAGIPTGWAITSDLVRRVATVNDGAEPNDIEGWCRNNLGGDPDYSALLDALGPTPAERQAILRSYIEPTEEERADGLKVPTTAHCCIARLVRGGYLRVILTTNFDRLMEQALTDEGVDFDVISTVDNLKGARPLGQAPCTVVKLHGDYRDSRILNTEAELAAYPDDFDGLLDRVLDEYGLVIAGWSGTWDPGLRAAFLRQANRRYGMWWVARGALTEEAQALVDARKATVVAAADADWFFSAVVNKVEALEALDRPHPLSVATAVAELKVHLPDRTRRVRLRDLVVNEARRVRETCSDDAFPVQGSVNEDDLQERVRRYEAAAEIAVALFAVGGAWGEDTQPWSEALEYIAEVGGDRNGNTLLLHLRRYPALRCLYAGGIAAVHAGNWPMLRALTTDGTLQIDGRQVPLAVALHQWVVFQHSAATWLPEQTRKLTPASNHLVSTLREPLRDAIASDDRYLYTFDRFEYLLGVIIEDQTGAGVRCSFRSPVGCLAWRTSYKYAEDGHRLSDVIRGEAEAAGASWAPLAAGLFGGSADRATIALRSYEEVVQRVSSQWL